MTARKQPLAARSLQEWMERAGINAVRLLDLVKAQTGKSISPTMLSFILRGSRRCSAVNAEALHLVTGVPMKALMQWPKVSPDAKSFGSRQKKTAA